MRKIILLLSWCIYKEAGAQITFVNQLPPVVQLKSQLWSAAVTNAQSTSALVYMQLSFRDVSSGFQLFTATSNHITLQPGTQIIPFAGWSPIQYNYQDPAMDAFVGNDFLPTGRFLVCYTLMYFGGDGFEPLQEDCQPIVIEPLLPPQLLYPGYRDTISELNPLFTWMGAMGAQPGASVNYDLQLVEVLEGQSAIDAVINNIPLLFISSLQPTNYLLNGTPALERGKTYAWRVLANERGATVAQSEAWPFTVSTSLLSLDPLHSSPYHALSKGKANSFALVKKIVRFQYQHLLRDTTWNIKIWDVTGTRPEEIRVNMEKIPLRTGINYISLPLYQWKGFKDKHLYSLKIYNKRDEVWELRFEYREND